MKRWLVVVLLVFLSSCSGAGDEVSTASGDSESSPTEEAGSSEVATAETPAATDNGPEDAEPQAAESEESTEEDSSPTSTSAAPLTSTASDDEDAPRSPSTDSNESAPATTSAPAASTTPTTASNTSTSTAVTSTTTTTTSTSAPSSAGPNILILIADDMGVESSPCYASNAAPAPNLAAACARGVVFEQAWSSPICSPTRSGILTGRHSFRTGIGTATNGDNGLVLGADEVTLPEVLDIAGTGYATANFGKWHLGGDADRPNDMGWDHFSGLLAGGLSDYEDWTKVTNGDSENTTTYATTANVQDAAAWIGEQDGPWLTWIGFNAPHTPFHLPPSDLHSFDHLTDDQAAIDADPLPYYQAAIEAMDTEIGNLLEVVDLENTVVIFIGDNGSPGQVSSYDQGKSKGSLAQGGVHVPMFAWGAGVERGVRSDALVGTIDIFATALALAGVDVDTQGGSLDLPVIDSVSFAPVLDGTSSGERSVLLSERFGSDVRDNQVAKSIRDDRYKLTVFEAGRTWFADLDVDPTGETLIRDNQRTADEDAAFDRLLAQLDAWTASANAPTQR